MIPTTLVGWLLFIAAAYVFGFFFTLGDFVCSRLFALIEGSTE